MNQSSSTYNRGADYNRTTDDLANKASNLASKAGEQIDRLREILPAVCEMGAIVSIDTTSAEVAAFALDAGGRIVNDVSAGRDDPALLPLVAQRNAALVLMHMLGQPKTMQDDPQYEDVVREVRDFLAERLDAAEAAGAGRERCIVDPGIGFGKRLEHNLALLAGVRALCELGVPVLIGASRKRFIGEISDENAPTARLGGSLAAACAAYQAGASIFRVHDVAKVTGSEPVPAIDRTGIVVACLADHIDLACSDHRLNEFGDLFHRLARRHRRVDVFARLECLHSLHGVQPGLGDDRHRIHAGLAQQVKRGAGI